MGRYVLYCLSGSVIGLKKIEEEILSQVTPSVRKGPMEGMVIVDGKPKMEHCDMPTISFTEDGLKRLVEHYKRK